MKKKIKILSNKEAVNFNPENYGKTAMIRISSEKFTPLKFKDRFVAILELNFLDITEEEFYKFTPEEIENLKVSCPNPYPISIYQAEQIIKFIQKYIKKIDTLIIHCDEGISRSSAVALMVAKYFLKNKQLANQITKNYLPNKTVIEKLEEIINKKTKS